MHVNLQDSVMYGCEGSAPRPGRLLSGGSVDCLGQNGALGNDHHVAAAIGEGRYQDNETMRWRERNRLNHASIMHVEFSKPL